MVASHSTCLVTGGAGFIGRSVVAQLLQAEPDRLVVVLDAMTYAAHPAALAALGGLGRLEVVEGDIADTQLVGRVMNRFRPGLVINLAAESHVDRSLQDCSPFLRSNVVGTQVLLKAALATRVQRFVQVSTDEVYGDHTTGNFVETDALQPSNPYAASKAAAENFLLSYARTYGISFKIVRPSNNFGVRQYPEKLIPRSIIRVLNGRKAQLHGSGKYYRDWLHVDDSVEAIKCVLFSGEVNEIYNISADVELTNGEVMHKLMEIMELDYEQHVEHVDNRPGQDVRYGIDDSKTRALGWKPVVDFEEGLAEIIEQTKSDPHW